MSIYYSSDRRESISRFTNRGFREFFLTISVNQEKSFRRYFSVLSSGRRNKVIVHLYNKWLWDSLTLVELELLFCFPEFFRDPILFNSFRVIQLGVTKKDLRKRVLMLNYLGYTNLPLNLLSYKGLRGNLLISFSKEEKKLPRSKKYSGYTKHYKDQGSLRSGSEVFETLLPEVDMFDHDAFIFEFLLGRGDFFDSLLKMTLPEET